MHFGGWLAGGGDLRWSEKIDIAVPWVFFAAKMALFTCKASNQNGKISNDCGAKMLYVYVMCHRAFQKMAWLQFERRYLCKTLGLVKWYRYPLCQ